MVTRVNNPPQPGANSRVSPRAGANSAEAIGQSNAKPADANASAADSATDDETTEVRGTNGGRETHSSFGSAAPSTDQELATQQNIAPSQARSVSQPGATAQLDLANWSTSEPGDSQASVGQADEPLYVEAGPLHVPSSTPLQTRFGKGLSLWMKGDVVGENIKRPRRREEEGAARAFLAKTVSPKTIETFNQRNVYAGDASVALRDGITEDEVLSLLDAGAGHHGIAFLIEAKDTSTYRPTTTTLRRLLHRWGPDTELVAERFVALARSERVKNPEELKSWYMGAGTKDIAADGYATMLNDAVDLIEAGHEIVLEEMPKGMPAGLGDIIDLTEKVVYQHKRVAGKGIGGNIKKAVKQLAGFNDVLGAPEGFFGVAQIDARNNKHFSDTSDDDFKEIVSSLHLSQTPNFDELQIVLDDRMLVFDSSKKLVRVAREGEQGFAADSDARGGAA